MRDYPEHSGGNILGYVSQVPDYILKKNSTKKIQLWNERSWKFRWRGVAGSGGIEDLIRDVWNQTKGSFENKYDSLVISGKDLELSIDIHTKKLKNSWKTKGST